jgi:lipoprotein-anchoring transpeptidase ErfK/SrfK
MTEDEIEQRLRAAFAARARSEVPEQAAPPFPRFAAPPVRRRRFHLLAPLAAAAAVVAVVGGIVGVAERSASGPDRHVVAGASSSRTATASSGRTAGASSGPTVTVPVKAATPVHITFRNRDDAQVGVGMPVVALFSQRITNGRALAAATTIDVNGAPVEGAWYFARSNGEREYPIEGHLRLKDYWPAHAKIHVALATKGLSAGNGMAFDDSPALNFATGARTVAFVDEFRHTMTVTRDGDQVGVYPVSTGAPQTPTMRGTKVIMAKGGSVCMSGPGYHECGVKYAQRLTYSGEYLNAAPWNTADIRRGINSSNGCTNLEPEQAQALYKILEVGDVVDYPNASGPVVDVSSGYGDWNVPWSTWTTGGLVPTH